MKMHTSNPIARIASKLTPSSHTQKSQPQLTVIDHSHAIDLLTSDRRRWAIKYLADHPPDEPITVSTLVEHVAAKENNCTVQELSSKQRERVYVAFVQSHLIAMQDIIEYDEDRKTITPTTTPARIWTAYSAFQHSLDG